MNSLRMETEAAQAQNEELQAKIKVLEQENLTKEQEIASLSHRNTLLDEEVEKLEKALAEAKTAADSGASSSAELDALQRKLQLLEDEAEEADKNLRETNEKLRLTDVKAEHYERKVATVEAERDQWEKKYEEIVEKYKSAQDELDKIAQQLSDI
ncbi:tropomyosin [Pyronema omphalodes]|nr:tropomyosin [Pyronema omphalodes]